MSQFAKWPFTRPAIDLLAPNGPGIYLLFRAGQLTYIGRAVVSIRDRLRSHVAGAEGRCTQSATHFVAESCAYPEQRERALLQQFRLTHGRLPLCNSRIG